MDFPACLVQKSNLAREHFYPVRERGLGNEILPPSKGPFLHFRLLDPTPVEGSVSSFSFVIKMSLDHTEI